MDNLMKWVIEMGNSRIHGNDQGDDLGRWPWQMQETKEKIEKKLCRFKIIRKKMRKKKMKKNLRLF